MNLREGTRRLALLLGVVGILVGGFLSYLQLQQILLQRADHKRFEQLASLEAVKHHSPQSIAAKWEALNARERTSALAHMTSEQKIKLGIVLALIEASDAGLPQSDSPPAELRRDDVALGVDAGGIKTVTWNRKLKIESLEMEDGETLYPTPKPSMWSYGLIVILPIFGFFVPWGVVRAIGWAGAGFVVATK